MHKILIQSERQQDVEEQQNDSALMHPETERLVNNAQK